MTAASVAQSLAPVRRTRRGFVFQTLPLIAGDTIAIFLAGAISVLGRYYTGGQMDLRFYLSMAGVIAVFISVFGILGLYRTVMLHPVLELREICRGTTFTVLLLGALTFFVRDAESYSRLVLLASWALIIAGVWFGRVAVRGYLSRRHWWGEPAVILAAGRTGNTVAETLRKHPQTGLRVVAILGDYPAEQQVEGSEKHLTGPFALAPALAAGVRYAIIAMPELRSEELANIVERYASNYHHVVIIPDLFGISSLGVDARDIGGLLGIEASHRLVHRAPQTIKRIFDLTAACLGGALIAPFIALIYLVIRTTSAGAGFYGQARLGTKGKSFVAWKFRTMRKDADQVLRHYLAENPELATQWERDHKLKNDPRVTAIGRFLRRTSLDELPQLWNVIRGEMSLVGPRPIVNAEIERYGPKYSLYMKVRPGLTGLWQVSGRSNTTYAERVQLDDYYVRNWSIWLDLYILSKTIRVVVSGDGAR